MFRLIDGRLLRFPFGESAEYGIAKSGRTYNHKLLWEHVRPAGCRVSFDYYPRGRVEIDAKGRPVVYMSRHIGAEHIGEIKKAFSLSADPIFRIDGSRHYGSYLDK